MPTSWGMSIRTQPIRRGIAIPVMVHFRPRMSIRNPVAKQPPRHPNVAREPIQLPSMAVKK